MMLALLSSTVKQEARRVVNRSSISSSSNHNSSQLIVDLCVGLTKIVGNAAGTCTHGLTFNKYLLKVFQISTYTVVHN